MEESIRVANYAAIITFPYHSDHVVSAEKRINAYYKALKGEDYVWLKEHQDQGLPDLQSIEHSLKDIECYHFYLLRGDISLWEKLYYSFFDALDSYVEWEFRKQIDQFYFSDLYDGDRSANCYRAIYVLTHEEGSAVYHYLEKSKNHISPNKAAILEGLLDAQKKIHLQQIITKAEDNLSTIQKLEYTNAAMEKSWKFDVQKWADDNAKNAATISKISQERDHLKNQLSSLQEQANRVSSLLELIENKNTDLLSQLRTLEIGIETRDKRNNSLSTQLMQLQEQFARAEKREAELSEQLECAKLTISKEQEKNMELTHQVAISQEQYEAIS